MKKIIGLFKLIQGALWILGLFLGTYSLIQNINKSSDLIGFIGILIMLVYIYSLIRNGLIEINKGDFKKDFFRVFEIVLDFILASILIIAPLVEIEDIKAKISVIVVGIVIFTIGVRDTILIRKNKIE